MRKALAGSPKVRRPKSMNFVVPAPSETFDVDLEDGAKILIRRHGDRDGVRVTVTHGNGFAADAYLPFWQLLTPRYDVLVFDFRNHGRNVPVEPPHHNYAQLARDLDRVRDAIDTRLGKKPTVGIFHSMSGRTAMKPRDRDRLALGWARVVRPAKRPADEPSALPGDGGVREQAHGMGARAAQALRLNRRACVGLS